MAQLAPKEFQTYRGLVERLQALGMRTEGIDALAYLKRVGYHRLGGYRYVFREMLPPDQQDPYSRRFRSDHYVPGTELTTVERLERWDAKLREVTLQGCSEFEVRLRAALAHVIAERDPYGYLSEHNLNSSVCNKPSGSGTKLDAWKTSAGEAERSAAHEDFIIHHKATYPGTPLPIWALVDILSIGSLPFLIDLLKHEDSNKVARQFGARNGGTLATWVRAISDLRNACAHHARLFNRSAKRELVLATKDTDPQGYLGHLMASGANASPSGKKTYTVLAVLAHSLRSNQSDIQWPRSLTTHIKKFPQHLFNRVDMPDITLEISCGFPADWDSLPLWTY